MPLQRLFKKFWRKKNNFGVPHPSLHRWGEIWHGGVDLQSAPPRQISPILVQHVAPVVQKNLKTVYNCSAMTHSIQ